MKDRPEPTATDEAWSDYIYNRPNIKGIQTEWWFHRQGCKTWFVAKRNTVNNEVVEIVSGAAGDE